LALRYTAGSMRHAGLHAIDARPIPTAQPHAKRSPHKNKSGFITWFISRDIHAACAVARNFFWSDYNMWPDLVRVFVWGWGGVWRGVGFGEAILMESVRVGGDGSCCYLCVRMRLAWKPNGGGSC